MSSREQNREEASSAPLLQLIREDFQRHGRAFTHAGFHALLVYRIGHWRLTQPSWIRIPLTVAYKIVFNLLMRNIYGIEITDEAVIGRRVSIAHHDGVHIGGFVIVGDDSIIRQGVTIGFASNYPPREDVPHLKRGVEVGAGACLLGPITIGRGARIGPNAVVTMNVPDGATAFAQPARIMRSDASMNTHKA